MNMTVETLRKILADKSKLIGGGYLSCTIRQEASGKAEMYIVHWTKPNDYTFEDAKTVGFGSFAECLDALDRYASEYRRPLTQDEVGMTLGLIPVRNDPPMASAAE